MKKLLIVLCSVSILALNVEASCFPCKIKAPGMPATVFC